LTNVYPNNNNKNNNNNNKKKNNKVKSKPLELRSRVKNWSMIDRCLKFHLDLDTLNLNFSDY
jgi:hypothetical protein